MNIVNDNELFFDVCIVCAMAEEVESLIEAFKSIENVEFRQEFAKNRREYKKSNLYNAKGEKLKIQISWPPKYGPVEMSLHLKSILEEFNPRFIAMTGICAGNRKKTKLGDIVVAERAYTFDNGKFFKLSDGSTIHEPDTDTEHPDKDILQYVQLFESWKKLVKKYDRPISKKQQKDWILEKLTKSSTKLFDDIKVEDLNKNAPDWKLILNELITCENPFLSMDRLLIDENRIKGFYFSQENFPYLDEIEPNCHIKPIASGSAVRSDNPFRDYCHPVRKTVAIDMESYPFYRAVADYPGIRSLLVKGVCDYADKDKDDGFHQYASSVSSVYIISFIKQYVTSQLMPRLLANTGPANNKSIDTHSPVKKTIDNFDENIKNSEESFNLEYPHSWLFELEHNQDPKVEELISLIKEANLSKNRAHSKRLLGKAMMSCNRLKKSDFASYASLYPEIISLLAIESKRPTQKDKYWSDLVSFMIKASERLKDLKYDIYLSKKIIDYIQDGYSLLQKNEVVKLISFCKKKVSAHINKANREEKSNLLSLNSSLIRMSCNYAPNRIQKIKFADAAVRSSELAIETDPSNWNCYMEHGLSLWNRSFFDKIDDVYNKRLTACDNSLWESICLYPNVYNLLTICRFYRKTYQTLPFLDCFIYYQSKEYNKRRLLRSSDLYGEAILQLCYGGYPEKIVKDYIEDAEYLLEQSITAECAEARHFIDLAFIKACKNEVEIGNRVLNQMHELAMGSPWTKIVEMVQKIGNDDDLIEKGFALGLNQSSVWNKLGTYAFDFLKDIDLAKFFYKEALRLNNNNAIAMTNLGRVLLSTSPMDVENAKYWISRAASHSDRRFQWWKIVKEKIDKIEQSTRFQFDLEKLHSDSFKIRNIKDLKKIYLLIKEKCSQSNLDFEFRKIVEFLFEISLGNNSKSTIFKKLSIKSPALDIDTGFTFFDKETYLFQTSCSVDVIQSDKIIEFVEQIKQNAKNGIYISMSGFSKETIKFVKKALNKVQILLIDGDDLDMIFNNSPPLDEAIRLKQVYLKSDLNPYYKLQKHGLQISVS